MQVVTLMKCYLLVVLRLLSEVSLLNCQDIDTFEECGVTTAVDKAVIKSPNYPKTPEETSKYDNNLNCLWSVDLNDPNTLFMVKFFDLVTQYRPKPNNETLCIDYVDITTESTGTEQFCGFTKPEEVFSGVGSKLEILFVSDAMYGYRGFMLAYQGVPGHDPCKDDPCKNGVCSIASDRIQFECDCEPGFTGLNCHVNINECASDPCKNSATCEQTEEPGYECFCTEGWQGIHCEIIRPPDPCLSNPCKNEGTCTTSDDNEEFYCDCVVGYTGVTCRQNINECESNPCQNGGRCQDKVNEYECACETLYYGLHCEKKQKLNGCREAPCSENGDCITTDDDGGYKCDCFSGWTGTLCDADLQECESNPCQNGGSCQDKVNEYECVCETRYYGLHCEKKTKINGCREAPCSENGDCITTDDEGGYKCVCLSGWTGTLCDADLQECESTPCQNGGICDDATRTNRFDCTCVRGYTGTFCEIAPPMCKNPGIPYVEEGTQWEEGSTIRFFCIEGYILQGSENSTCLKNESWSTKMPECIVDSNSTAIAQVGGISPWLGTMIVLSSMFAVTLVAFITWIMLKGPWNFAPNGTRIMSISQTSLVSYDPHKQC